MEELKKVSPEAKQAFKKHYSQMHRAFERLTPGNKNHRNNLHTFQSIMNSSLKKPH